MKALFAMLAVGLVLTAPSQAESLPTHSANKHKQLKLSLVSQSYSEGASIKAFSNDLHGASAAAKGSYAISHTQAEAKYYNTQWCVGLFERFDRELKYNPDTLQFYIADSNDYRIENRRFDIHLQTSELRSRGVNIAYRWVDSSRWQATWQLNLLSASDVSLATLDGSIAVENGSAGGLLNLDYLYRTDQLLDRPPEPVDGLGYSLDVDVAYQFSNGWLLSLQGQDAYSRIEWQSLTATQATIDTNTLRFNAQGIIDSKPALSGRFDKRDTTLQLPARWQLTLQGGKQNVNQYQWRMAYQRLGQKSFLWFKPHWQFKDWQLTLPIELTDGGLGVVAKHNNGLYAELVSDALEYDKARYLKFSIGWQGFF